MRAALHPEAFVRVRVPASVERSLHQVLSSVHAPFFTLRESGALVVTLQETEWMRVAGRFSSSAVEPGLRLISIDEAPPDPAFVNRLARVVAAAGVPAAAFSAFYRDHLVVPAEHAQRSLDAVQQLLDRPRPAAPLLCPRDPLLEGPCHG